MANTVLENQSDIAAGRVTADPLFDSSQNVDVLEVLIVLKRGRRKVFLITAVTVILGIIIALLLRNTYKASALIMPPVQPQSVQSAFLGQLGSLGALAGSGASSLLKNPGDMYVSILRSRSIADGVIEREKLASVYKTKTAVDTRHKLDSNTKVEAGKDSLIKIDVTDHDANRAAAIVGAYLDELYKLNSKLAVTEAGQRRIFYDEQIAAEKKALAIAESDFVATQKKTGIIVLSGQTEAIIRSVTQLRAQIAAREVQLGTLTSYATAENPAVELLQKELAGLRAQLDKLEQTQGKTATPGDIQIPTGVVPELGLEYVRSLREVKFHETLYELLLKQDEIARLDEGKSAQVIQVVDRPVPPDKKSGPLRPLIIIGALLLGLLTGCGYVLLMESLKRLREQPAYAAKFDSLRRTDKDA
jgi:tyrosine-protein kinase Etk/Wzc